MSRTVSRLLSGLVKIGTAYARPWRRAHLRLLVAERLHQRHRVDTRHGPLVFVSTHPRALEAPREFHRAEPGTLVWIDGFAAGDVLWDIGANVGVYSLYAGRRGDIDVLAFEPSPASYAALCDNVAANRLARVRPLCLALGSRSGLGTLNMSRTYPGSVYNAFEQQVDMLGKPLEVERLQPAMGVSIDDLVERFGAPPPTHIKLDVDSTECDILRGAERLLSGQTVRSISIENTAADTPQNRAIAALLQAAGFRAHSTGQGGGELTVNVIYRR